MSWLTQSLSSTLGRKLIMSLTGLFLITFLIVHVAGNLQLLRDDGGEAFNIYAHFMTSNPVIRVTSILLYAGIIAHVVYSIILTRQNRKARPVQYAASKSASHASWASRNMGVLGTIILIFLVVHLRSFWYEYRFGEIPVVSYDGAEYRDIYTIVKAAFSQWWYSAFYLVSLGFLGFHLAHGFSSAFQTVGINHKKYSPFIQKLGLAFAIIVPFLFAIQPVYLFWISMQQ